MGQPILETRHLKLVCALDEAGTLHGAARRLHVTPSALSQQLRDLEAAFGGALFHRRWRRLEPTSAGRELTERARVLLDGLTRAEGDIRLALQSKSGAIRFATACFHSYEWLPAALKTFAAAFPSVNLTIVPPEAVPGDGLASRHVDVFLTTGDAARIAGMTYWPLFTDELVALAPARHPSVSRGHIDLVALADEHLWLDGFALHSTSRLSRALAAAGADRPSRVTTVPHEAAIEMVRAGMGLTVMPAWSTRAPVARGDVRVLRLGRSGTRVSWVLVTRDKAPEPACEAFIAALRAAVPVRPARHATTASRSRGTRRSSPTSR